MRADGVVWSRNSWTTPPRLLELRMLRDFFLIVAATPPPAEEGTRLPQLSCLSESSLHRWRPVSTLVYSIIRI